MIKKTNATYVLEKIQGYGSAIRRGLRESKGDLLIVTEPDGSLSYRVEITGDPSEPELLAKTAYQALVEQGAAPLLERLY